MLKTLKIRNYQSLRDVDLALRPFTVIVGESNSGKSAVIRAMNALLTNELGERFKPPGATRTVVEVETVGGDVVTWEKGASATYTINGKKFAKFGATPPPEVRAALRMGEIRLEDKSTFNPNVHQQFDQPFLLGDTGSRVARVLGEITNVNLLYLANREAQNRRRAAVLKRNSKMEDLEKLKDELFEYRDLKDEVEAVKAARSLLDAAIAIEADIVRRVQFMGRLEAAEAQVAAAIVVRNGAVERASALESVPGLVDEVERLQAARRLLERLETVGRAVDALRAEVERLRGIGVPDEAFAEVSDAVAKLSDMRRALSKVSTVEDGIKKAQAGVQLARAAEQSAREEFEALMRELGNCPLCGSVWEGVAVESA